MLGEQRYAKSMSNNIILRTCTRWIGAHVNDGNYKKWKTSDFINTDKAKTGMGMETCVYRTSLVDHISMVCSEYRTWNYSLVFPPDCPISHSLSLSGHSAVSLSFSIPLHASFLFRTLSLSLSQSFSLFPTEHLAILYALRCLSNAYTRSSFIQSFSSHTAYSLWHIPWPTTNSIVSMSLFFLFRNTISDAMEYTEENSSSQTSKMFTINRNHSFCYNSFSDKKPGKISHRFA